MNNESPIVTASEPDEVQPFHLATSSEMEVVQITNVKKRHNERKMRIRNERNSLCYNA